MKRETLIQHHGEDRERQQGAAAPVIYRTSLFAFPDSASLEAYFRGDRSRHLYSRDSNPTVRMLEEKFAVLEEADDALAFASGMGAVSAVLFAFLGAGDQLLLYSCSYGPTLSLARRVLRRFGVDVKMLGTSEFLRLDEHITDATRLIYVESPASLTFEVLDLEAVADVARRRGIPTVCDNSWGTPIYHRPVSVGIDLTVHSGTKYVGGHSDILLGLVAGSAEGISRVRGQAPLLGAALSPEDAALALRGLRTLPLRMERHRESALWLAEKLEGHPRVKQVLHPALESFPTHDLWKRQFFGSSGLFSFLVDGDPRRFCDALELFLLGVSWGGHESIALPAVTTKPVDPRISAGWRIPDELIRLSVGLEDPEDLWKDLERAFDALD